MSHKLILLVFSIILLITSVAQCVNLLSDPRLTIVNVYSGLDSVTGESNKNEKPISEAIISDTPTRRFLIPQEEKNKVREPEENNSLQDKYESKLNKKNLRKMYRRKNIEAEKLQSDLKYKHRRTQTRKQNLDIPSMKNQIDNFAHKITQSRKKYVMGEFRTNGKMPVHTVNNTQDIATQISNAMPVKTEEIQTPEHENEPTVEQAERNINNPVNSSLIRVKDVDLFLPHTGKRKRIYIIQFPLIVHHGNHTDVL